MYHIFAVKYIGCGCTIHIFPDAQAVLIVRVADTRTIFAHTLQLPTLGPGVRPGAVVQRVANGVVGNGASIVDRQLVLPVGVAVGESVGLHRGAQRAGGVGTFSYWSTIMDADDPFIENMEKAELP